MISLAKLFLDVNRGLPKALYNKAPGSVLIVLPVLTARERSLLLIFI